MSGFTSLGKKNMGGSGAGGLNANSIGPFGTALVSGLTPIAQATFAYGINDTIWSVQQSGLGGSTSVVDGIMQCNSGISGLSSTGVHLKRSCKYRAGQGTMARFTTIFGEGMNGTRQLAGIGNGECGYYFAMIGSNFGILHRERSTKEIVELTITTGVGTGVTLIVTLGGATKSITITGGGNVNQTAYLISKQDYSTTGAGFQAEAYGNKVYFISNTPGPIGGVFSVFNGASSISTSTTIQAGILPTETFIPQSSWNIDTLDGNGSSRMNLDPRKGNVYGIGYQYLGFGNPFFSVENPETGLLMQCHMIQRAGKFNTTVLKNPTMTIGWSAINEGTAVASTNISGASAGLFLEGEVTRNIGPAFAADASKTNVGSTEVPILSIRANKKYKNMCNYGELAPFNISLGNDSGSSSAGKLLKIQVYKNISLTGPTNFQNIDSDRSMASIDTSATGISIQSGTQLLKSIVIAANNSLTLSMEDENFFLANGEVLTITAKALGQTIDMAAVSISWFEDQ